MLDSQSYSQSSIVYTSDVINAGRVSAGVRAGISAGVRARVRAGVSAGVRAGVSLLNIPPHLTNRWRHGMLICMQIH